ncbi:M23 family metallopeptidase [Mucilaginibacter corticis]|uniref:M23 family metallopeptidase n=1 Tax=Mucilaginibacter corticis TaxID=2597670 RepID=A0A556MIF9_9SPHI|nr:M23 family metallopeptidase [Mucilaginibacter corticis]TSJ39704.1 M23 family metallopeptidase [Mucilaginibacter corticis]
MKLLLLGLLLQISLPLKKLALTSGYGYRLHPITKINTFHAGVDLKAHSDTVYAITNGRVTKTNYNTLSGIYIKIDHGAFQSLYGHLSQIFVNSNATVAAGQPIGITGATGTVTGEHLHFAITINGAAVNPIKFLVQLFQYNYHE